MSTAEIKSNTANNYKISTRENYMKENGLIDSTIAILRQFYS